MRRNGCWTLAQRPLPALAALRHTPAAPHAEGAGRREWRFEAGRAFVARCSWAPAAGDTLELRVADADGRSLLVSISAAEGEFRLALDRGELWDTDLPSERITEFTVDAAAGREVVTMELYADTCAVELFFDDGALAATELVPWSETARSLVARWSAGSEEGVNWEVNPLEPITIR